MEEQQHEDAVALTAAITRLAVALEDVALVSNQYKGKVLDTIVVPPKGP